MMLPDTHRRTIISATEPKRFEGNYCDIFLKVWFEELDEPVLFMASIFDCEGHGRRLWFKAMAGQYGEIEVMPAPEPPPMLTEAQPIRMLTHDREHSDL